MNSGVRVSIPNSVRKTIQNLKEITGNHSEDEIYAMLKECSMDPNETAQKLLLQDPFHEVRRKRDRKKENPIKESTEPRWKPGMQGRGNRGGRGNYSSRRISQDAGGSRNALSAKENGINQVADDDVIPPKPHDTKNKDTSVPSVVTSSPSDMIAKNTNTVSVASDTDQSEVTSKTSSPLPGVYLSAPDPILMPSKDSRLLVDTIRHEIGSQRTPVEQVKEPPIEIKTASIMKAGPEGGSSLVQEGTNLLTESSRSAPSTHNSSSIGRPPSNYNNRSQQAIGFQKVGPVKEWKPKPTNPILAQGPGPRDLIEVQAIPVEAHSPLQPVSSIPDSKDNATSEKEKQDESHISDGQHVIIPNHLHVPEAEKLGFRFGSFDASFGYNSGTLSAPVSDKSSSPSEASEGIDEHIEEPSSRNQDVLVTADDGDYADRPPSSSNVPENLSAEGDVSSSVAPEYTESKQETSLPTAGHQYPVVQASPNLSFGFMPPIIGSHLAPFESSGSQVRDASRVPGFVVQQPFDPASYYAQFYRSGADSDGRISPFHSPGVATKYNGNVAVLSPQASQSSQEVGNSLILTTASPTPSAATQTAGVMQSSIAVTQQPLPVFRQPAGLHLPHYPPNYIPYGPYFSPFYIPPPAIHQFLSNGTFPQQPQAGGIYPAPPVATAKYPLPQYKPGSNTGPGHVGMAGTYGLYGSNPAGYNPSSGATAGKSTSHEDHNAAHFKENNVYVTGQQSEGSGVWIAAPGQDISGSFYNLPQGSQVAYTPTQPGHGPFANIYHPAQPVTTGPVHPLLQQSQTMTGGVEMVGPTSSVYPQPQPTQINWPNNY